MKKIVLFSIVTVFLGFTAFYIIENRNTYNIFTVRQEIIDGIVDRFDNNALTKDDKKTIKRIYGNIIFFGGIIYPEASKILKHYMFGNGEEVVIRSKYFFESDIVTDALRKNPKKEIIGPITLKISKNPRIAYAVNGFYIKNGEPAEIYQEINFAGRNDRNTYTDFDILGKKLKIPDRLVRAFESDGGCKTFTVRIRSEL